MKSALYIPTNRPGMILGAVREAQRTIASCSYTLPIYVVIESQHRSEVAKWLRGTGVRPLMLPRDDMGIGYSRHRAVSHASRAGYDTIIMLDDDEKIKGNIPQWLRVASRDDVVGVGSYRSIYGLLYKDTLMAQAAKAKQDMTFLHRGSAGYQSFALNVANAMEAGNFNMSLRSYEDHELCRQGMARLGLPWYIYTGVRGDDRVPRSQQRGHLGEPGSPARAQGHQVVSQLWPEFISAPPKRHMCRWSKLIHMYLDVKSYPLEDISTSSPYDWRPL